MYFSTEIYGIDNVSIIFLPYFFKIILFYFKYCVPVASPGSLPSRKETIKQKKNIELQSFDDLASTSHDLFHSVYSTNHVKCGYLRSHDVVLSAAHVFQRL